MNYMGAHVSGESEDIEKDTWLKDWQKLHESLEGNVTGREIYVKLL